MTSDFVWFLVGSIIPLYCAGYAGLIHIARKDTELYGVIKRHAYRIVFPILGGVSVCAIFFIIVNWSNENRDWTLLVMIAPPFLLIWHAWYSSSFFDSIISIPSVPIAPNDGHNETGGDHKEHGEIKPKIETSTPVPEKTLIRFSFVISTHG